MSHLPPDPPPSSADAQPRVGIVIRTRDRPLFVARALQSVLAQSYRRWQVILVNDGGDAGALQATIAEAGLARLFGEGAMRLENLPASIGRSAAFNHGAAALDTEFVCCLDDDDTWAPEFLAELVGLYDRTLPLVPDLRGVAAMVTALREDILTEDGAQSLVILGEEDLPNAFKRRDFFLDPVAYATYRHDLYPVQWMLNRAEVLAVGGFPESFSVMEDRAFMTKFLQRWRVATLDRKLAFHHRRVQRHGDTAQSVAMNTLDNPSYDWRLYSDLAKISLTRPPGALPGDAPLPATQGAELIRAAAATVIRELNEETSALWHKLNGEAASLRARIEALDARIGGGSVPDEIDIPAEQRRWSLWDSVGAETAFRLGAGTPFLERLSLSMADSPPGLLMHASAVRRQMVVQIPRTEDWAALELSLTGLARRGEGLRCDLLVSHPQGYLFETALSAQTRDRLGRRSHALLDGHVHACMAGGLARVTRIFTAADLARVDEAKLSIALPRQALDFRFICHDLVVSRV